MLEYLAYKKFKKHRSEKQQRFDLDDDNEPEILPDAKNPASSTEVQISGPAPVLREDDESFIESILSSDGPAPPLPPRPKTLDLSWDLDGESLRSKEEGGPSDKVEGKRELSSSSSSNNNNNNNNRLSKIQNRLSHLFHRDKKAPSATAVDPSTAEHTDVEADRERNDISRLLDDLNLSVKGNKAFSLSDESTQVVRAFTLVLKDLVNGVPTAYGDLTHLLDDKDGVLARNFERLPASMQKLVASLPNKFTASLAPELLAAAAKSQGIEAELSTGDGIKGAAKVFLTPKVLQDLVTKPGAIVTMLKAIVNALKLRWPAFMGVNIIWSIALFILLFVLWYCHKRGREVRLAREKSDDSRIEDLPDDPALPAPETRREAEP